MFGSLLFESMPLEASKKKAGRRRKTDNSVIIFTRKSIGAVQISNDLTIIQRKIMNILIYNSQKAEGSLMDRKHIMQDRVFYSIQFSEIEAFLGWEKYKDRSEIGKALKVLTSTALSYGRDNTYNKKWDITGALLSDARYENLETNQYSDIVYYSFSAAIEEAIIKPKLYAPINLGLQNKFESRISLALNEYLNSELSVRSTDSCETKPIPINDYVYLVAGSNVNYTQFKEINRLLIKKPLVEVNTKSDLTAEAITHKKGRKVIAISHTIARKEKYKLPLFDVNVNTAIKQDLDYEEEQTLVSNNFTSKDTQPTIEQPKNSKIDEILIRAKVSEAKRKEFALKYSEEHIIANLEEAKSYAFSKSKSEASAPLIISAIKENYANFGAKIEEKAKENLKPIEIVLNDKLQQLNLELAELIKHHIGETTFNSWFKELKIIDIRNNESYNQDNIELTWYVPSEKVKNCIFLHYSAKFERAIDKLLIGKYGKHYKSFQEDWGSKSNNLIIYDEYYEWMKNR